MSLYAEYLREKTGDEIIETKDGFATFRFTTFKENPAVYIVDIYVIPALRNLKEASSLADTIVSRAKKEGCKYLLGSVIPSNKGSTSSLKVLLAYGMSLDSSSTDFLLFKKEI